jgi:ABC-type antimicrobial peptide transport system permease subunit
MAVASMLPLFSTFFPLWMLGGGWLAVTLYRRRSSLLLLTSTIGGKIGALAGLLGFAFFAVFTSAYLAIATVVLHKGEEIRATLRSVLDQAASTNHDMRAQALSQWMQTPEGLALIVALSMLLFLVAFLLLSTAGGIFAASLSRRKLR